MSRRSLTTLPASGGAAAVLALTQVPAHAASFQGGNYGAYGMEGQYPTVSSCAGTFQAAGARAPARHGTARHQPPRARRRRARDTFVPTACGPPAQA